MIQKVFEAKSLKNGLPTLCKGLQFNSSATPCRPPKQTNKIILKYLHVVRLVWRCFFNFVNYNFACQKCLSVKHMSFY